MKTMIACMLSLQVVGTTSVAPDAFEQLNPKSAWINLGVSEKPRESVLLNQPFTRASGRQLAESDRRRFAVPHVGDIVEVVRRTEILIRNANTRDQDWAKPPRYSGPEAVSDATGASWLVGQRARVAEVVFLPLARTDGIQIVAGLARLVPAK